MKMKTNKNGKRRTSDVDWNKSQNQMHRWNSIGHLLALTIQTKCWFSICLVLLWNMQTFLPAFLIKSLWSCFFILVIQNSCILKSDFSWSQGLYIASELNMKSLVGGHNITNGLIKMEIWTELFIGQKLEENLGNQNM